MNSSTRTPLLIIASLSVAAVAILISRRVYARDVRTLTKDELLEVLKSLCNAFADCLAEPSQCVQRADMISSQRRPDHDSGFGLNEEEMANLLMQGGVGERMESLQEKIFRDFNVTQEEMQTAQDSFSDDDDVLLLLHGLDSMLGDFLDGGMAVNPLEEPISDEKRSLLLLSTSIDRKEEEITQFLAGKTSRWPTPADAAALANISNKIEKQVCVDNGVSEGSLLASVAVGTNKSRTFRKSLMNLLFKHQCIPRVVSVPESC
jgi:hypothetical protein